jgi:hypothetical protein
VVAGANERDGGPAAYAELAELVVADLSSVDGGSDATEPVERPRVGADVPARDIYR